MPSDPGRYETLDERLRAIDEVFESHRASVDQVLSTGDSAAIKNLYVELGEMLERATGDDVDAVPLLSFPENAPTIGPLLGGVEGRLLDAGCGPYPAVSILLGRGGRRSIVAVDIGVAMVRLARARAAADGVALKPVVADLEALPFRRACFDGSVCEDTIEHVPDDRLAIEELSRVLKPGARLVLATPNRHRLDVLVQRSRDRLRGVRQPPSAYYAATSHLREYTWSSLHRLVRPAFSVRRRSGVAWSGGWKARTASRLVGLAPLRRLSRMIVLVLEPR